MNDDGADKDSCDQPIKRWTVLSYGVGHMLNDITAACWFTYLLVFLTDIGLSPRNAAVVMLSGQVADGFANLFAGELIDRFGHFKQWHGIGSVLVAISFSSVFGGSVICKILGTNSLAMETIEYSFFASVFNIGWASTQVSHMSMVNYMTLNSTSRVVLASCRNAFTMVANLSLYGIAFTVFGMSTSSTALDVKNQYRWIAYVSIFIGCCFVAIFYLGTNEPRSKQEVYGTNCARISWSYWFKKVLYYQVAIVYVLTRIVTNVSQAFLAFYVIDDLNMAQSSKALVPAIIYTCSFFVSILLQEMKWTGKRLKLFYSAGATLWIFCGIVIIMLPGGLPGAMYPLSVVIGIANALMMVTAISMQSFLVGDDLNGSAFIYGSFSFFEKMACGIALYILESYEDSYPRCRCVTRIGLGLVPGISALLGVVVTYTIELRNNPLKSLDAPLLA